MEKTKMKPRVEYCAGSTNTKTTARIFRCETKRELGGGGGESTGSVAAQPALPFVCGASQQLEASGKFKKGKKLHIGHVINISRTTAL
jgi:hypothetical protein